MASHPAPRCAQRCPALGVQARTIKGSLVVVGGSRRNARALSQVWALAGEQEISGNNHESLNLALR